MRKLFSLVLVITIAVSLVPASQRVQAEKSAEGEPQAAPEQCLRKVVWLDLKIGGQLKARWFNILNFCYDGTEITDWQLNWRPRTFVPEWRYVRVVGPRITGTPVRWMLFATAAVFRGRFGGEVHTWRPGLWQQAFPNGRWVFGGRQQYW